MKASELRLGNRVYWESALGVLNAEKLSIADWVAIAEEAEGSQHYKPIPITEEWLKEFGFEFRDYFVNDEEDDEIFMSYRLKIEKTLMSFELSMNPDGYHDFLVHFTWQSESGVIARIQFIHQLQNLYFALTGKELEKE